MQQLTARDWLAIVVIVAAVVTIAVLWWRMPAGISWRVNYLDAERRTEDWPPPSRWELHPRGPDVDPSSWGTPPYDWESRPACRVDLGLRPPPAPSQ